MAAVAELEAGLISERTKAALAAARRGNQAGRRPRLSASGAGGLAAGVKAAIEGGRDADHAAHRLSPAIDAARRELGADASLHAVAAHLTAAGVPTPRGGARTATAVRRASMRIATTA